MWRGLLLAAMFSSAAACADRTPLGDPTLSECFAPDDSLRTCDRYCRSVGRVCVNLSPSGTAPADHPCSYKHWFTEQTGMDTSEPWGFTAVVYPGAYCEYESAASQVGGCNADLTESFEAGGTTHVAQSSQCCCR